MSTVILALVCFAVAFVFGVLLGKSWFATRPGRSEFSRERMNEVVKAQRIRYRKRVAALNNVIRRHEEIRGQIREKLQSIEKIHDATKQELKSVRLQLLEAEQQNELLCAAQLDDKAQPNDSPPDDNEVAVLKIERDDLSARLKRLEAEASEKTEPADTDLIAQLRATAGELHEKLAQSNRRAHELECALNDSRQKQQELSIKLEAWQQRVTPLTRQLRQQNEIIQQISNAPVQIADKPQTTQAHPAKPEIKGRDTDDLQAIRGIGPALERRLNEHGIHRYEQLAALGPEALADISRKLSIAPSLIERDSWILQARTLFKQGKLAHIG